MNERKKMITRIIDDIILRIYFPRTEEVISTVNSEIFVRSIPETSPTMNRSAINFNTQGTILLLNTSAPELHTMITRFNNERCLYFCTSSRQRFNLLLC